MEQKRFALLADITTNETARLLPTLERLLGADHVTAIVRGFRVSGSVDGEDAEALNQKLLSAIQRAVDGITWRSEWTRDGTTERFSDAVSEGRRPAAPEGLRQPADPAR